MKVRQAGYEYRGFKLGQKVMYEGELATVIGFDENTSNIFLVLFLDNDGYNNPLYDSRRLGYITSVLPEHCSDKISGMWASMGEVTALPNEDPTVDLPDEDLPPAISPIHALDILSDIFNSYKKADLAPHTTYKCYTSEQHEAMAECIRLLKGGN